MDYMKLYNGSYCKKRVLITGLTGFKGSWLALWLNKLGAEVLGISLEPLTNPNHYDLLAIESESVISDIKDYSKISPIIKNFKPDIVFHLAAQPLVRLSYNEPLLTYETNVLGTANILESCRNIDSVRAIVNITTDKCYENKEWVWGYRENDPMGGYDPYSSSKGCAELVISAYRNSFFNLNDFGIKHNTLVASARAGNVIGGGDWAPDRLIPDSVKAANNNEIVTIRSPHSTRPWEHVLEPLSGYLMLGQKLLEGEKNFAEGWNFGPGDEGIVTVENVMKSVKAHWNKINYKIMESEKNLHEANLLKLDCSKAYSRLGWKNVWDMNSTFKNTIDWYKEFYENKNVISEQQLDMYVQDAIDKKMKWTQ